MAEEPSEKEQAKLLKKLAKAEAKQAKKEARPAPALEDDVVERPPATTIPAGAQPQRSPAADAAALNALSPAERSAAAAERNLVLQHRRFLVGLIAVLIGLFSLIFSWWSWQSRNNPDAASPRENAPAQPVTPGDPPP